MSATSTWHPSRGSALGLAAGTRRLARPAGGSWSLAAVALVIVVVAAWWVTNSPIFDMRSLEVRGNRRLTDDIVASAAGLGDHTNVLWSSPGAIERRLESDPWILSAEVSRTLPASLSVQVRERRAVAILASPAGFLVAADGMVLGRARPLPMLPMIQASARGVSPGERLSPSGTAIEVAAALPRPLRRMVQRIEIASGRIELRLRNGARVLLGDRSQLQAKTRSALAVLSWARGTGRAANYVDVTAPGAPAISLSRAATPAELAAPNPRTDTPKASSGD